MKSDALIPGPPFQGAPDAGKLAVGGVWEEAVTFAPGEYTEPAQALTYLAGSREVACEAFFGKAFFGVRRRGEPEDLAGFVTAFAVAVRDARSGEDFFGSVQRDLGITTGGAFLYAEAGAEGSWASVGPVRIDPAAEDGDALAAIARSPLADDTEHDKALEFTYDSGESTTHWVAWPISRDRVISPELVAAALAWFATR